MDRNLSQYNPVMRRLLQDEDTRIGFFAIWAIGLVIFPLGGFYLGTIFNPDLVPNYHFRDLVAHDITFWGGIGALVGLALGTWLGLWATFRYPVLKERENAFDEARAQQIHLELTHREEFQTIPGQEAEHHPLDEA